MNENVKKTLRLVYQLLVTVALIGAGLCLIVACVGIYQSGDRPFSREAVAAAVGGIAVPVYAALALVVLGFVLAWVLPQKETADKPDLSLPTLRWLQQRADLSGGDAAGITRLRNRRRLNTTITAALLAVGAVIFLVYACNFDHFHRSEINSSMIKAMWILLPCVGVPFAYGVFAAYDSRACVTKEIALLRQCPQTAAPAEGSAENVAWLTAARIAILLIAVLLLVIGLLGDGFKDVLTKAVNICTECIGLG
ncbi:MAG: hypothetical protein IJE00_06535 [Clostridia bacterium]|nr:hypothetical protein [Clostridia bacterium]